MFVSPMLLHKTDCPFDDDEYITELKLDGIRLILSKFDDKVRLYTRHNNEVTAKFPELLSIDIPNGTVIDGEIIVTDSEGKPDFEAMMERFQSKRSAHRIQYCVFDVIYYKGDKVANLPLVERKELLESFLQPTQEIVLVQWMHGNGEAYFKLTQDHSLEGVVLKKADSAYKIGKRSHDWLKVINYQYTEAFITGMRKDEFGLLLGVEEGGKIKPAGIMEFMNQTDRRTFYQRYRNLIIEENNKFIFIDPQLKCRVKFRNYTKDGKLRIPSFVEYIS
ncbi:ATP-dependent DNA ligase [Bacillus salipaludis]|uniref:RNA ligase family protein n=1 Tax=Bacillus salipaludis TaxID=2547811 RepID=A0AA90TWG7_9BACI|nr:RNA ligase family protein [Bacillus salipaludis]MDQ6600747.1 RNA ligase family protein [Bacillus salipaludis]